MMQTKEHIRVIHPSKYLIPSTLSKCPDRFVNGVYPKEIDSAKDCRVQCENDIYYDFISGLGPIILGYRFAPVDDSVIKTIRESGTLFSLPNKYEKELAFRLGLFIPCSERVKILKTGSEALSAAVKVARAKTGRDKVLVCGYHGWHDWFTASTDKRAGIVGNLEFYIEKFKYNNIGDLRSKFTPNVAAVVMEPMVYEYPNPGYLEDVRKLCNEKGSVLIFDEVVTGFRWNFGGAQKEYGVTPDIACFSKAMGNGYPIAVVCGKKEFMDVFDRDDFFVSGTFGGDLVGISAALAVIRSLADGTVLAKIHEAGNMLKNGFQNLISKYKLNGVYCIGHPARTMFDFPTVEHKGLFWQECVKRGVLFGYANFINLAHTNNDFAAIKIALGASNEALKIVADNFDNPKSKLEGEVPKEVFRMRLR